MSARARRAAVGLLAALAGCAGSSRLDAAHRAADAAEPAVAWADARREDLVGYFESERVSGDAAASLRRVYYVFEADGSYTGAALVTDGAHSTFQVLAGHWTLRGTTLSLGDDAAPARVFSAPDRLRLDSEGGSVVLHRGKLH
ncbi:MAG: hypothetical protein U1E39_03810 [Planctomycetota bacterium]